MWDSNRTFTASQLKDIAVISMIIDHANLLCYGPYLETVKHVDPSSDILYLVFSIIGRFALVLFAFLLAEGFRHTSDRKKYLLRLIIFAVISQIPYHLTINAAHGTVEMNIMITFALCFVTMGAVDAVRIKNESSNISKTNSIVNQAVIIFVSCMIATMCRMEYGLMAVLLVMLFYYFPDDEWKQFGIGAVILYFGYMLYLVLLDPAADWIRDIYSLLTTPVIEIAGLIAFRLLRRYDGSLGKAIPKWFYYVLYPAHLMVLYFVAKLI